MSSNEISRTVGNFGIDFDGVMEKACEIFGGQALLDKKASEITLKDLEIGKAKANNFLDAVQGILEIGHQVEIMSADQNKFKRQDELDILHSLLRSVSKISGTLEKTIDVITKKIDRMLELEEVDIEEVTLLQGMLQVNIDSTQKVIASAGKVINIERVSGGRIWGSRTSGSSQVSVVEKLENSRDDGVKAGEAVRAVSWDELRDRVNNK